MLDFGRKILEDGIYGDFPDLKTLIYNDFGCFFRRTRQNKLAMEFFEKALNLIGEKKKGLALTLLNITALLSQISE